MNKVEGGRGQFCETPNGLFADVPALLAVKKAVLRNVFLFFELEVGKKVFFWSKHVNRQRFCNPYVLFQK